MPKIAAKTDENKTRDNKPPNFMSWSAGVPLKLDMGCIDSCEDVGIGQIQSIDEMHICFAWKEFSRVALVFFMVSAAGLRLNAKLVNNLLIPIVPPPLPAKLCVYASGVAELLGGLLLIANATAIYGAWLIIATLVAVFPANVYHAVSKEAQRRTKIGPPDVYVRLPIQLLFLAWARWHLL